MAEAPPGASGRFLIEQAASKEKPRLLTPDELKASALAQFSDKILGGRLTKEQVEQFVEKRVAGIKINGVDVISIDIGDHRKETIDPVTKSYMDSDRTERIVAEYFEPDLKRTGVYRILKSMFNYFRRRRNEEIVEPHQILGEMHSAHLVAEACREAGKPVVVCELADKGISYILALIALRGMLLPLVQRHGQQRKLGTGIYDKTQVTRADRIPDFEQARRLYLAKGIELLTQHLQQDGKPEGQQVVVLYPRAHTLRMEDTLINPRPVLNKARSSLYKLIGKPLRLDFSLRQWEYKGEEADAQKAFDGWEQTSAEPITM